MQSNANLRALMSISDEQLDTLVRMAYKKTDIKKGQVLIQQGDLFADKFYVVEAGELSRK